MDLKNKENNHGMKNFNWLHYHVFASKSTEIDYSKGRKSLRNITGYLNKEFKDCVRTQNLKNSYCSGEEFNNFDSIKANKHPAAESWNNTNTAKRMKTEIWNHKITHSNYERQKAWQRQKEINNCLNKTNCSDEVKKLKQSNNTKNHTGVFYNNYNVNKLNNMTENTHTNIILPPKDVYSNRIANKNNIYDEIDSSDDNGYSDSDLNLYNNINTFGNSGKPTNPSKVSPNIYEQTPCINNYTQYRSDLKSYDDLLTSTPLKETFGILTENNSRPRNMLQKSNKNFNRTSCINNTGNNKLEKYSNLINRNIKYSNILYPNVSPTEKMKQRMDNALDAILYIINETICKNLRSKTNCTDRKLFYRLQKSIVRKRIRTALMGQPVGSRSDIIDIYLKTYPKETDTLIIAMYRDSINYPLGSLVPNLIQTDDPKLYYKVNMMRLINIKLKKIITVIENMYKHSNQQSHALLNKPIQKCGKDMKYKIQKHIIYDELLRNTIESRFSKLLEKFKNEIVVMILERESSE